MILGVDVSTYFEEIEHGAKYFDGDKEISPLDELRKNGVSAMRIRLWVDPKSESGEPYLAGNCDLDNFIRLATLAQEKGFDVMLDIHYSDFWADPKKQCIPKSWANKTPDELVRTVHDYTAEVLRTAKKNGINVRYIQVGNEITNGMLWTVGMLTGGQDGQPRGNYDMLCRLIKSGATACREECPNAEIILHLERSHDQAVYDEFYGQMQAHGVDYDIIGMSYYPYWHGTFDQYFANVENCKKWAKKIMTVELGYAFTLEDYIKNSHGGAQLVINVDNVGDVDTEYPISPDGQASFVEDFLERAEKAGIAGVFWWEPLWLPGDGICWASPAGQKYIREEGKSCRNEWSNQCLFDYDGKMLPSFRKYKI